MDEMMIIIESAQRKDTVSVKQSGGRVKKLWRKEGG
jgi:hypothetical protein